MWNSMLVPEILVNNNIFDIIPYIKSFIPNPNKMFVKIDEIWSMTG